jgi:hypothetical protein
MRMAGSSKIRIVEYAIKRRSLGTSLIDGRGRTCATQDEHEHDAGDDANAKADAGAPHRTDVAAQPPAEAGTKHKKGNDWQATHDDPSSGDRSNFRARRRLFKQKPKAHVMLVAVIRTKRAARALPAGVADRCMLQAGVGQCPTYAFRRHPELQRIERALPAIAYTRDLPSSNKLAYVQH